ncbi:hypothetical protein GIB67_010943 [Kingdonia uniflora]|uniref:hydroxyethylthiazole kinase n=1 Tax=Kingdonia uniflora TaxID=39325 RepID=A0A7J7NV45_9MAGN|nr:hypothetical protein GIB67_010943 [Kingdonia uniflora]
MNEETKTFKEEQQQTLSWPFKAWTLLSLIRTQTSLIQCITNFVSMDLMANTLLSSGASPAMIHSLQEIPDFTPNIKSLCINIGTLTPDWLPSMKSAAMVATQLGIPWVLDPVAVSASEYRMKACLELVGLKPSVIRGNASEICALGCGSKGADKVLFITSKFCTHIKGSTVYMELTIRNVQTDVSYGVRGQGVDSSHESMDAVEAAKSLARASGAIVAVSGAVDIVTDGQQVVGAHNGVAMMQRITATGCAVTALIATFVAVDPLHPLEATVSALSIFGVAGEMAMDMAKGPASLRMHLIDCLYGLDQTSVLSRVNITSI